MYKRQQLNQDNASKLYGDAADALIKLQLASKPDVLPPYDEALLTRELNLFPDWYISKHLGIALEAKQDAALRAVFETLNKNILAQGQVYVHRDYHSRNLMVCDEVQGGNPGVLDFQDAVYGAVTYDLVSLLKDAYISWDEEQIIDWTVRYWEKARKAGSVSYTHLDVYKRQVLYVGYTHKISGAQWFACNYF